MTTPSPTFKTCERCALRSTLVSAFSRDKSTKPWRTVCPRCALHARVELARRGRFHLWATLGIIGLFAIADGAPWLAVNLLLCVPATAVAVVWHELGHAWAASAVGMNVVKITLGIGPVRFEPRWLGYQWEIRRYAAGGAVWAAARTERFRLARVLAMVFAGPGANLLLAGAGWWILGHSGYAENVLHGPAPIAALVFVNAVLGIANLAPFRTAAGRDSDGRLVLLALVQPAQQRGRHRESDYALTFLELRRVGRFDDALAAAKEGAERFPDSAALLMLRGIGYVDVRRFAEARSSFAAALERCHEPAGTAILHGNLAYLALADGDASARASGAELAMQSYDVLPWEPAIADTRASYLVLEGRPADAIAAIEQILGEEFPERDRKSTLGTLALAYEHCGNHARAEALRRDAHALAGEPLAAHPLDRILAEASRTAPS